MEIAVTGEKSVLSEYVFVCSKHHEGNVQRTRLIEYQGTSTDLQGYDAGTSERNSFLGLVPRESTAADDRCLLCAGGHPQTKLTVGAMEAAKMPGTKMLFLSVMLGFAVFSTAALSSSWVRDNFEEQIWSLLQRH